ncbi:TenA/THI-4 family protein [Bradyrhizobium sp. Leo170]|uniref:TenA/THI-4 family protein n=2 Tax=Bradyrhizobium TaxID=374 RepID=UPI001FE02143|nr:TenA/THI-4 family protein [Bradyrhizobium sp. Leo170]
MKPIAEGGLKLYGTQRGALIMAQLDDFRLIREIVAAGRPKPVIEHLDKTRYQRLVELGWLKVFPQDPGHVLYQVTERGRAAAARS